jgi:hypothetical protein
MMSPAVLRLTRIAIFESDSPLARRGDGAGSDHLDNVENDGPPNRFGFPGLPELLDATGTSGEKNRKPAANSSSCVDITFGNFLDFSM